MAEVVFRAMVQRAGLDGVVATDSAGTGDWHIGERADRRAVATLAARGYDGDGHRAREFDPAWFGTHQVLIALDRGHERALRAWAPNDLARSRVHLLRRFSDTAVETDLDVADPYYDGQRAFDDVLDQIEDACGGLLDWVVAGLGGARAAGSDAAIDR
jgi:protein-tyrosine phosphatase